MMNTSALTTTTNVSQVSANRSSQKTSYSKEQDFNEVMDNTVKEQERPKALDQSSENTTSSQDTYEKSKKEIKSLVSQKEEQVLVEEVSIDKMEEEIEAIVSEKLGLSAEAIAALLEQLNMTLQDLVEPENLQMLTKTAYGVNSLMEVLVDANEASQVRDLFQAIQNVSEAYEAVLEQITEKTSVTMTENLQVDTTVAEDISLEAEGTSQGTVQQRDQNQVVEITVNNPDVEEEGNLLTNAKTDGDSSQGSAQNSGQENFEFNTLIQKVGEQLSTSNATETFTMVNGEIVDYETMVKDLVEQFRVQIKPEVTKMEFQLNPEHLGKLNLSVVTKEGVITAELVAESQMVKDAIENQLPMLKQTLTDQGLKVDKVEVILSNEAFNQQEQQEKQDETPDRRPKIRLGRFVPSEEEVVEEVTDVLEEESHINYTA